MDVEIVSVRMRLGKCRAKARVDGQLCAEAEISSVLVDRA
jgi:3-hydroxymyristoyl/3-hydroxydecanoyl-(acyl carrier protein) dehydratase